MTQVLFWSQYTVVYFEGWKKFIFQILIAAICFFWGCSDKWIWILFIFQMTLSKFLSDLSYSFNFPFALFSLFH